MRERVEMYCLWVVNLVKRRVGPVTALAFAWPQRAESSNVQPGTAAQDIYLFAATTEMLSVRVPVRVCAYGTYTRNVVWRVSCGCANNERKAHADPVRWPWRVALRLPASLQF